MTNTMTITVLTLALMTGAASALSPLKIDDMTDVTSTGRMVGLLNLEK
jgi:hypothetical protein